MADNLLIDCSEFLPSSLPGVNPRDGGDAQACLSKTASLRKALREEIKYYIQVQLLSLAIRLSNHPHRVPDDIEVESVCNVLAKHNPALTTFLQNILFSEREEFLDVLARNFGTTVLGRVALGLELEALARGNNNQSTWARKGEDESWIDNRWWSQQSLSNCTETYLGFGHFSRAAALTFYRYRQGLRTGLFGTDTFSLGKLLFDVLKIRANSMAVGSDLDTMVSEVGQTLIKDGNFTFKDILWYFNERSAENHLDSSHYSQCFFASYYSRQGNDSVCERLQTEIVAHYKEVLKVMKYTLQPLSFIPIFESDFYDYQGARETQSKKYTMRDDAHHKHFRPLLLGCKFGMKRENLRSDCSMFKRAFSFSGLVYVFNSASIKDLFNNNKWTKIFHEEVEKRLLDDNSTAPNLAKPHLNGPRFALEFLLQVPKEGAAKISLQESSKIPDTSGEAFKVFPGTHTSILVTPTQVTITPELLKKHPKQRQCYSRHEKTPHTTLFKYYSNSNCIFECNVKEARSQCGCIPWDFPRWEGETPICSYDGAKCFSQVMEESSGQWCSQCLPDCETVHFEYSVQIARIRKKTLDLCKKREITGSNDTLKKAVRKSLLQSYVEGDGSSPWKRINYHTNCFSFAKSELASISVYISPAFATRITRQPRVTFADQLANLGKQ